MNQVQDNEIDFFDLFETLWDGKWLISTFVAIALLLGGGFLLLKDALYESKLIYSVNTIPPFYNKEKTSKDFKKKFYSASVFEDWKKNNSDTSLVYEDFSMTEVVNGIVLSKNEDKQFVTLESEKKGDSFVLVKTNQLTILDNFFEYATHINGLLKKEYVIRAKEELKIIEARFNDLDLANSNVVNTVLSLDRYVVAAEKGESVLAIQHPTKPKKVSPLPYLILPIALVLGGMLGVFFVHVRNIIAYRKEKLVKA